MKKKISVFLTMALIALSASACSSQSPDAGGTNTPVSTKETPGTDAGTSADLGDYEMIIGHAQPEGHPRTISVEKFAEDVAERTGGHVKVSVFGNGQLGTEKEMLEQTVAGTIQGMKGGQYDFSPRLLMFTLPFLTQNREQVTALFKSNLAKRVCEETTDATGTVIINLCDAGGYRQFSNNQRRIARPEDLVGLKMRTNGMTTIDLTFKAMGATTCTVPYTDLYMALKTSVADGQENPWVNVEGMKFYEVQKYFTEVNYQCNPDPFYVNGTWWNSLPEEYRTIIQECAEEMGDYNDRLIDENSEAAKQAIIDSGAEVYVPTEEELQAFQDAAQTVYDQCIEAGILTEDELQEIRSIVEGASN